MTLLIKVRHDNTGLAETLVGIDAIPGITVLAEGSNLGTPTDTPMYSRTLDSTGVLVTGATREAREQTLNLLVEGDTPAEVQDSLDRIMVVIDRVGRKGGGTLFYRSANGTKMTRFRIAHAKISNLGDIADYEAFYRSRIQLSMVVDPLGQTDPLDFTDAFAADTLGLGGQFNIGGPDWTKLFGTSAANVSGGSLVSNTTNSPTAYVHSGTGNLYSDVQETVKANFGTLANLKSVGVLVKGVNDTNYIAVHAVANGAGAGTLYIEGKANNVAITGASVGIAALAANTDYWVRGRLEENTIIAEWFTNKPTPLMAPIHTVAYTLTDTEQGFIGKDVSGQVGIYFRPVTSAVTIDDFSAEAFTYRARFFPRVLTLNGDFGGSTDARMGVSITTSTSAYSETMPWSMLLAWWAKPEPFNRVLNHSGEADASTFAYGWRVTALTGIITNAATNLQRVGSIGALNRNTDHMRVTTHASGASGPHFPMYTKGGFKRGVKYTFSAELKSVSHTSNARLTLGVNGNLAHSAGAALTTGWVKHTGTWIPTADVDIAYIAPNVTTASATQLDFRRVQVYEGVVEPRIMEGGYGPGIIPAVGYTPGSGNYTDNADANYLIRLELSSSGQLSLTRDYYILPHLFGQDDFTNDEVDIAVYMRSELTGSQPSLNCTLSVVPESGTTYATAKYSEFYADGKQLRGGTGFKPYYLGTVTVKTNRADPRRVRIRLSLTSSVAASGTFGLDYLIAVPAKNVASSMTGALRTQVPAFVQTALEATKFVKHDLSVYGGAPRANQFDNSVEPDSSLLLSQMMIPNETPELLVWPSSQVIDGTDGSGATLGNTATIQVSVQPQVHLLNQ